MKFIWALAFLEGTLAATVTYNWSIGWVRAAPDGVSRSVIGINGQWPCPKIEANLGDTIVVNVYNALGNETTGLHFHGQSQVGTQTSDGPSGITQCSIPPGASLTYSFTAQPAGTHWYHSHNKGQYPDGLRGPLIVHDPQNDPYAGPGNGELVLTLSDWYWEQMPVLLGRYLNPANSDGNEPAPNSTLINDSRNVRFPVSKGRTYRVRIINMGSFAAQNFKIDGHQMIIIAIDGVPIQAQKVDSIYITVGQRYDVLFVAKPTTTQNYFFISSIDQSMIPGTFTVTNPTAYGYFVYDSTRIMPAALTVPTFNPVDDMTLVPYDMEPLLGPVDHTITLSTDFESDSFGINRGTVNGQTFVAPIVPTLYTALSAPTAQVMNPTIYGVGANPFIVSSGQIVEIVILNNDTGSHPWHMHGHSFQVVYRGAVNAPMWDGTQSLPRIPMKRDTVMVNTNSSAVWRFKATNPGVWLIHCHIEWHVEAGLTATLVESPDLLQQHLTIPAQHVNVCKLMNTPVIGNAAGNSNNFLNMTGQPTTADQNDYGSLTSPLVKRRQLRFERNELS